MTIENSAFTSPQATAPADLDVLVVGLGFGRDFAPIYQRHPAVARVGLVDPDSELRASVGEELGITDHYASLDDALAGGNWAAVHLLSPVRFHHSQVLQVLRSGRHCASAVPAATELRELDEIVAAEDAAGRVYMMMETGRYSREFFLARELRDSGRLGRISFGTGEMLMNLDGFPHYWLGYPPMKYLTHALSPILALAEARVEAVRCVGSSELAPERVGDFGPGYATEVGLFQLRSRRPDSAYESLTARITQSFFQLGRCFSEGFCVYGDQAGLEWPQIENEPMVLHELQDAEPGRRGREVRVTRVTPPSRMEWLPPELACFEHSWHGGSHPHLVHEFVSAIVQGRRSDIHARVAATWTAPGICAHESAQRGGDEVLVPDYGVDSWMS